MKAFFFFLGFFLFLPVSSFAGVSGNWIGWGEWTFQGEGTECKTMRIAFEETAGELRRLGGTFDCGIVVLHSDPLSWERRGDDLFLDGRPAGKLYADGFATSEPYDDEGTMVHTRFKREGSHADYEERWVGKDGGEIYLITGRLFFRQ